MSKVIRNSGIGSCNQPPTPELQKNSQEDIDEKLKKVEAVIPADIDSESVETEANISNVEPLPSALVNEDNAPEVNVEEEVEEGQGEIDSDEDSLPDTVTILEAPNGSKVYVVGTAHFSVESIRDVDKTIRLVRPQHILLEICKYRTEILRSDQETLMLEYSTVDAKKMVDFIKREGAIRGIIQFLDLSKLAHVTKQLGMGPGGEFRAACVARRKYVPNASLQAVDRSIHITSGRAIKKMTVWQKMKFFWCLVFESYEPISHEDIEKSKEKDYLDKFMEDPTEYDDVIYKERDMYLSYKLYKNCFEPIIHGEDEPHDSVAVVGIGHARGIKEHWGKVTYQDIEKILQIPQTSRCERMTIACIKLGFWSLLGYGTYKFILPNAARGKLEQFAQSSFASVTLALKFIKTPTF